MRANNDPGDPEGNEDEFELADRGGQAEIDGSVGESSSGSDDDDVDEEGTNPDHPEGYQLLSQGNEDNDRVAPASIQDMIGRAQEEQRRELARERTILFRAGSSTTAGPGGNDGVASAAAAFRSDSIAMDSSKVEAIKVAMSGFRPPSLPPWAAARTDLEWDELLKSKLSGIE